LIVDTFPGFRDQAIFKGKQTFFYKRAQILVADLIGAFDDYRQVRADLEVPDFTDKEALTMFADYRVPQSLRHVGIFEYSEDLAQMIDQEVELAYSGGEEVELRAATIVTVDRIMHAIKREGSSLLQEQVKYSFQVDWMLWQIGEKSLDEMKPHHRVLSIYY
jgi:hypothetical protein